MIKIGLCDDNKYFLNIIKEIITKHLTDIELHCYSSSTSLLKEISESQPYDIYILDIVMAGLDGMKLAKLIKKIQPNATLIFVSSHDSYVFDSFSIGVFRYIPKRHINKKLLPAVTEAINRVYDLNKYLYVVSNNYVGKISYSDLIYVCKENNNVTYHTQNEKIVQTKYTIDKVAKNLKSKKFIKIERGFIINIEYVDSIRDNNVLMTNGHTLPISRRKIKELKAFLLEYWGELI